MLGAYDGFKNGLLSLLPLTNNGLIPAIGFAYGGY